MKNKRLYLLPVILFSLIIVFRIFSFLYTIYLINKLGDPSRATSFRGNFLNFQIFFWPCLLIAEIVIYCIIRKRIYNRQWVIVHCLCTLLGFVILPLSAMLVADLFSRQYSAVEMRNLMYTMAQVRFWVFYFFLFVGHVFFILTIVKSIKKKQEPHEPASLLDEFVS